MYEQFTETTAWEVNFQQSDTQTGHYQHPTQQYCPVQQQNHQFPQMQAGQIPLEASSRMEYSTPGSLSPKSVHRRAKKAIPDKEKDERYWERRLKNNLSARRSRESKRSLESSVRRKVYLLEQQNVVLRKEIDVIKKRYGLPTDQSVMTPEQHEECLLEIKTRAACMEAKFRKDICNSVELPSLPNSSHNLEEKTVGECLAVEMSTPDRGQVNETARDNNSSFIYGPPVYGLFNPSPIWAAVGMQPIPGGDPEQSQYQGPHKQASVARELQRKGSMPYNYTDDRGVAGVPPSADTYYWQFSPGSQMRTAAFCLGSSYNDNTPADLSMRRSKGQKHKTGCSSVAVNMRSDKTAGVARSEAYPLPSSTDQVPYIDDRVAKASSLGQVHAQFCGPFKLPFPVATYSNGYNYPGIATPGGVGGDKLPTHERLLQENALLNKSLRTLSVQADQTKDMEHTA